MHLSPFLLYVVVVAVYGMAGPVLLMGLLPGDFSGRNFYFFLALCCLHIFSAVFGYGVNLLRIKFLASKRLLSATLAVDPPPRPVLSPAQYKVYYLFALVILTSSCCLLLLLYLSVSNNLSPNVLKPILTNGYMGYVMVLGSFFPVVAVVFFAVASRWSYLSLIFILVMCSVVYVSGFKLFSLLPPILFFLVYQCDIVKSGAFFSAPRRVSIVTLCVLLLLFSITMYARIFGESNGDNSLALARFVQRAFFEGSFTFVFVERLVADQGFMLGATLFYDLLSKLPAYDINFQGLLSTYANSSKPVALTPMVIGEAYANFGTVGVALSGLMMGLLFRYFHSRGYSSYFGIYFSLVLQYFLAFRIPSVGFGGVAFGIFAICVMVVILRVLAALLRSVLCRICQEDLS